MIRTKGREVVESQIAEGVSIIKTEKKTFTDTKTKDNRKLRVAAYCRVSKDIEQQESSYETQMATYKRIIAEHSDWELVKIYADRGITGTSLKARAEFSHMMEDAESGLIDLVLVKSISRFSRNTVDMLESVRHLKDIGVAVYFEKEKINTMSLTSELLITVFAAFAQEESHSISENMRRGMRQRFKMGKPKLSRIYGYDNTERAVIAVNPEQAAVVKRIFDLYVHAYSTTEIADILNAEKVPTPKGESDTWLSNTINGILHNEKYIGDCLMQKTVTVNHLTHAHTTNLNVDSYYKEDHHEAIVDKKMFNIIQYTLYMKDNRNGVSQYPYYGFLKCPDCGKPMIRIRLAGRSCPNAWVCPGEGENGFWADRNPCNDHMVRAEYLDRAVLEAFQGLKAEGHTPDTDEAIKDIQETIEKRKTVELYYLSLLVESIELPDWDTVRINWKDKSIEPTVMKLECDRAVDHPNPVITDNGDGTCTVGSVTKSLCGLDNIVASIEKSREILCGAIIKMPEPNAPIQLPNVKMGKYKREGDEQQ